MKRCWIIVLTLGWLLSPAEAQRVQEVEVRNGGAGSVDAGFVRGRMQTAAGADLDRSVLARDVRQILETGRFTAVDVSQEPVDGGLRVVVTVVNKYRLDGPVAVEGARAMRASKIRDLLDLASGEHVDDPILGMKSRAVLEAYRKKHYPDAKVSWTIRETQRDAGLASVTLRVDEGARAVVKRVVFIGNERVPSGDLRRVFEQPARWNPLWWFRKKRFEDDELDVSRLKILDLYAMRGFLDAEVKPVEVVPLPSGRGVEARVTIREGECYRVASTRVTGNTLFPEAAIDALVGLKAGDVASSDLIQRSAAAIRDYYGSRGYIQSSVRTVRTPLEGQPRVMIEFAITEGALTRVRNILVQGNTRTRDKVVRRELLVYPGEIFDEVKVRRSERIVRNLGFFSDVRAFPLPAQRDDERDLVFQVEEKRTGNLALGMGFSSVDNVMGFLELSQGNFDIAGWPYFTGAGQKLKLHAQAGSTRQDYGLTFIEPWFLDRKLSLGFDLYRQDVNYDDYDVRRTGVAVSLAKALTGADRIDLRYRIEESRVNDIADTNEYVYADDPSRTYSFMRDEEDLVKSSLTLTLIHDTRDNPFVPSRGTRATLFGTIMGGPMGFDTDLYNVGLTAAQYVPLWFRHVLSLKARCEVVEAYGDTDEVPIEDRLFIGGGRTLRGFEYRDVGPKVIRSVRQGVDSYMTHRPVGGQSLAMATAEYTVPLVPNIRWAAFYDIGNVWEEPFDFDFDVLASGAGTGIRFDIPGFPIRIDYAWAIEKDSDLTDEDAWVFWIGHDF